MLNTTTRPPAVWRTSATELARSILRSPRALLAIGALAIAGGVAANWSWMVAIGAAPVILGLLPCAAMCALGLCMPMGGRRARPVVDTNDANGAPLIEGTATRLASADKSGGREAVVPNLPRSVDVIRTGDDHACCAPTEKEVQNA